MDTYTIDIEIEHYYGDRMATSNREACRRLYLRAVSKFHGPDLEKYLNVVQSYATAYASMSHVLRSPFRHVETPLFLSSLMLVIASMVMILNGDATKIVACGLSAGVVGMINCARRLLGYWQEYAIREAVLNELVESIHKEQLQ